METNFRILVISRRIGATTLMIGSVWLLWRLMTWLPWELDCVITVAAVIAFAHRFEHEVTVRIVKRPTGTWDGVPLHEYVPGECYEVSHSIGEYLVLQGYAAVSGTAPNDRIAAAGRERSE